MFTVFKKNHPQPTRLSTRKAEPTPPAGIRLDRAIDGDRC